jgi:hypothetical protein
MGSGPQGQTPLLNLIEPIGLRCFFRPRRKQKGGLALRA